MLIFASTHLLACSVGLRSFNMTKPVDGSEVIEENYVPVDKSKLKEDQQKELRESVDRYERECLKSYSITRSGELVKKFDFPSL